MNEEEDSLSTNSTACKPQTDVPESDLVVQLFVQVADVLLVLAPLLLGL